MCTASTDKSTHITEALANSGESSLTVVQVAGDGGMGEDEVVEVGVLLDCWKISSSKCECPGGEVATSD